MKLLFGHDFFSKHFCDSRSHFLLPPPPVDSRELQQKYEKRMKMLREDLELRRKQEVHEIEERKNLHINDLMKKHEKVRL